MREGGFLSTGAPRFPSMKPMSLDSEIATTVATLQALTEVRAEIERAAAMILGTLRSGGKILTCGNGGSAAEAGHLATELIGRYARNRMALPAIALSADSSALSCIGNDYGFEQVFARQVAGLGKTGDLLIVLSSSGNSANLLAALREARARGLESIALLGRGGGAARGHATCEIVVPGASGRSAQEVHLFLIHHFCEQIDAAFAG